jgi:hypothetical protein
MFAGNLILMLDILELHHHLHMSKLLMGNEATIAQYFFLKLNDVFVFDLYFFFPILFYTRAAFAFNPKDVNVRKKESSPSSVGKLTELEIKDRIDRLSLMLSNTVCFFF